MKLITISGLDGSGKTTQVNLLEKSLKKKGAKVFRFHAISFSIANKFLKPKENKQPGKSESKTTAGSFSVFLRKIALLIDIFRFRHFYLMKNYGKKYDFILADRYFYDQIVNIKFLEKNRAFKKTPLWQKIAEKYIIKPKQSFYLKISPEEILERDREIDQDKEYLIEKEKIYENFAGRWNLKILKASNKDKLSIHKKIIENC
jgi:thymidylate kinase